MSHTQTKPSKQRTTQNSKRAGTEELCATQRTTLHPTRLSTTFGISPRPSNIFRVTGTTAPPSISATMRPPRNPIQPSDKTFGSLEQPESPQLEYADPPEDNSPPDIDSKEEILPPDNGGNPLGPPDGDDDPDGSDPGSNHSHHPWTPHRSLDLGNQFLGALQHLAQNLVQINSMHVWKRQSRHGEVLSTWVGVKSSDGVPRVFQGVDRKGLASTCKKLHPSYSLLP